MSVPPPVAARRPRVAKDSSLNSNAPMTKKNSEKSSAGVPVSKTPPQVPPRNTEESIAKKDLLLAILSKDIESIPALIDEVRKHTNINFRDGKNAETLIHKCVNQSVDFSIITMLLESGSRIDARDINKASPLHYAALSGNAPMVEFLIKSNANTMLKDKHNQATLHKAAAGNHPQIIEILLGNSALINHRDIQGYSALHIACQFEKYEAAECLVQKGADVLLLSNDLQRPVDCIPKEVIKRKLVYSVEGKKIFKLLKRKGGCKERRATASMLNGRMKRSIGHRATKSFSHDTRTHEDILITEEVELDSSEEEDTTVVAACELIAQKVNNAPRVDKLGFIREGEDTQAPLESHKKAKKSAAKDQKRTQKWLSWVNDWENSFEKHYPKILKYCDYGIPDRLRGQAWKLLSGIAVEGRDNEIYYNLLKQDSWEAEIKIQIEKDIHRTMPGHILFQEESQGRQMLTNVLLAYSMYNPEVGYCQGMGFISAMFLMYMPEEDAFWLLDAVADMYGLAGLWKVGMVQVRECMSALRSLMQVHTPKVQAILDEHGIPAISYVPQFFMTGFLYNFPFDMVVRLWDSFWLRRFDFFYSVAVSVFKIGQPLIVKFEMEEMMDFLKFKDGTKDLGFTIEQLLECSIHIYQKLKPQQLRQWEEEARDTIQGRSPLALDVKKAKDTGGSLRSPRQFVKIFSSNHSDGQDLEDSASVSKTTVRRTRKNKRKKKGVQRAERTYSLPKSTTSPMVCQESTNTSDERKRGAYNRRDRAATNTE